MTGNVKRWVARLATLAIVLAMALGMIGLGVVDAATPAEASTSTQVVNRATKATSKKATTKKKAIGRKKALAIALKDAKLKKSQVKRIEIDVDRHRGKKVYEVEFRYGKYEYEYDIDYYTGKILEKEVERD